jgi:hypothetical protein
MYQMSEVDVKVIVNALNQELKLPNGILSAEEVDAAKQLIAYYQNLLGE